MTAAPSSIRDARDVLVADVMIRAPKTLPSDASVAQALSALSDEHVHLLLLVDHGRLVGTVTRSDLGRSTPPPPAGRALDHASLDGRVVGPAAAADVVMRRMHADGVRRLAVTCPDGRLLGLVCLKHHGRGFCSDEDVGARATPAT